MHRHFQDQDMSPPPQQSMEALDEHAQLSVSNKGLCKQQAKYTSIEADGIKE